MLQFMKRSLLISSLVVLVSVSFQAFGSGIIQDRKPHGDYIDRAAPAVPAEARKEMDARLAYSLLGYQKTPTTRTRFFGSAAGSLIRAGFVSRLKSTAKE
jgi:hypothetical protein